MEVPSAFYYLTGTLILTNIGTVGAILVFAGKAVWYLSRLDSRVEKAQETANRAHQRVDKVSDRLELHQ